MQFTLSFNGQMSSLIMMSILCATLHRSSVGAKPSAGYSLD